MKKKNLVSIVLFSFVVLALLTGMTGPLQGQGNVVSKFGRAQVAGREVIVHVTVLAPAGADANQVAIDAIRNQGARPFQSDPLHHDRPDLGSILGRGLRERLGHPELQPCGGPHGWQR